jgi:hypothetical protein
LDDLVTPKHGRERDVKVKNPAMNMDDSIFGEENINEITSKRKRKRKRSSLQLEDKQLLKTMSDTDKFKESIPFPKNVSPVKEEDTVFDMAEDEATPLGTRRFGVNSN